MSSRMYKNTLLFLVLLVLFSKLNVVQADENTAIDTDNGAKKSRHKK